MKTKIQVLAALILAVLLTSCSNGLKLAKKTNVSFYMDQATVNAIINNSVNSERAATEAEGQETASEASEADLKNYFIDVTLYGETEETKTLSLDKEIQFEFEEVPINSRVYAKAQIYTYTDSDKTKLKIIYRGESAKITVRDGANVLSLKLATAKLTITFESNGGTEVPSQSVVTGSCVIEPENPVKPAGKKAYSRENFAFAGWYTDEELTQAYDFSRSVENDFTLYAKWIPGFVFVEGATVNNYLVAGRNVKVSDLFVSDHEVTQAEYKAVTNENPSNNKTYDDLPVENVTWFEAIEYCNKLSEKEGLTPCYKITENNVTCSLSANGYRLPTEAEWEYIANKAKRDTELANIAWYKDSPNLKDKTHQVKYNLVDELCLSDLYGNVAEWCFDVYSDTVAKSTGPTGPMAVAGTTTNRVVRGGSYKSEAAECTSTARAYANPTEKNDAIGFRVVRTVVYEFKVVHDTVSFDSNGGSSINVQIVVEGDCASVPVDPEKRGYIFKGWQYGDEAFDFATPVTQDITLTAKWQAITYTVKFNYNSEQVSGGSGTVTEYAATYDQNIQLPAASTITAPTGWHFSKWSTASDPAAVDLEYDPENPQIKNLAITQGAEVTLYAIWEENGRHTITYNNTDFPGVDISALKQEFREAEAVDLQSQTPSGTRTGYTFEGWFDSSDIDGNGTGNEVINWAPAEKTDDVVVYARWTANEYEITYVTNSGTWKDGFTPDSKYTYNVAKSLPGSDKLIRAGYGLHWYINGTEVTEIAAGTIGPVTVSANWVAGEVNYTVHHMKQNVDGTDYEEDLDANGDPQILSGTTGAQTAAAARTYEGFTAQDFTQQTISGDGSTEVIIFYTRDVYKVTYESGISGETISVPAETDVLYGATYNIDFTTSRTGYVFAGWKDTVADITYQSTGPKSLTMGAADITLTAQWEPATDTAYKVIHRKQKVDGSGYGEDGDTELVEVENLTGTTGTQVTPTAQTYTGFTALTPIATDTILANGSTEIVIKYDRIICSVTYDDGVDNETISVPASSTVLYGATINVDFALGTRIGYTFAGWKFDGDVYTSSGTTSFTAVDEQIILTAQWEVENQNTGIDVGFGVDTTTIEVTAPTGNGSIFTAPTDYDSYSWTVDGEEKSTVSLLDMFNFATVPGVYDITLTATKTVNGNTVTHTWTGQYIKN